jgi:hypothetical protein
VVELPQSDTDPKVLSGSAEWYKPSGLPSQTYYPAGFRIPLELFGELLPAITATSPAQNARSAASAHEITVFGGNLAQAISKSVSPFPGGTQNFGGDEQMVFSVRPSGKFSGSFIDSESRERRRFIGASLPTSQIGGGFFLGSDEGGGVVLSPAP